MQNDFTRRRAARSRQAETVGRDQVGGRHPTSAPVAGLAHTRSTETSFSDLDSSNRCCFSPRSRPSPRSKMTRPPSHSTRCGVASLTTTSRCQQRRHGGASSGRQMVIAGSLGRAKMRQSLRATRLPRAVHSAPHPASSAALLATLCQLRASTSSASAESRFRRSSSLVRRNAALRRSQVSCTPRPTPSRASQRSLTSLMGRTATATEPAS